MTIHSERVDAGNSVELPDGPRHLPYAAYPKAADVTRHGLQPLPESLPIVDFERAEAYRSRRSAVVATELTSEQILEMAWVVADSFAKREPRARYLQPPKYPPAGLMEARYADPFGADSFGSWDKETHLWKEVCVVGAGNSAGQAAMHLSKYASKVTILARGNSLATSMSDYLIKEIEATGNVEVRPNTRVVDGGGHGRLERLVLENSRTQTTEAVPAAGLFVLIGAEPHTGWLPEEIKRDDGGYVVTGGDLARYGLPRRRWHIGRLPLLLETSMRGVFAVGDVRSNSVKRVASSVGEGSVAVTMVHQYLASTPQPRRSAANVPEVANV